MRKRLILLSVLSIVFIASIFSLTACHDHSYVGKFDAESHWTECECGEKTEKDAHTLVYAYDAEGHWMECECGYKTEKINHTLVVKDYDAEGHRMECDCGYITEKTAHTLVDAYDATGHWTECECGYKTEKINHTLVGDFDTAGHWTECECGYKTEKINHTLVGDFDAIGHWTECECGYKTEKINHTLVDAYDTAGHWTECECGYKTEKINHALVGAFDATGHWTECECGYKTEKINHTLVVKDYDAEGHRMECDCGYITEKTAHNISNGVCSVCGYELMVKANVSTFFEAGDWDDFVAVETFKSSNKLLIFEFKPSVSSGSVEIELWNNEARVSSRIGLAYDGTAPAGTTVTDIGNGWYRFEVEFNQFTYASGYENSTFLRLRFRNPTADMLIANIDTTQVVVHTVTYSASSSSYTYAAGEWDTFVAVENWNSSDKVLSFEYKPSDTTKGFYIQLLNGSDTQVSEQLALTGGTLSEGHGTITDIGDGWFRYECALSEIGVKGDNGAETFSKIKFRRGNLVSGVDSVMIRNLDTTQNA